MDTELKCTFRKIIIRQQSSGLSETCEDFAPCYKEGCIAFHEGKCIRLPEFNFKKHNEKPQTDVLDLPIEELGLSMFALRKVKCAGIKTIGELVEQSKWDILRTKNIGQITLNEILSVLGKHGLSLKAKVLHYGQQI